MQHVKDFLNPSYYFRKIGEVFYFTCKPHPLESKTPDKIWVKDLIVLFFIGEVLSVVAVLPKAILEEYDVVEDLNNILGLYQSTWRQWKLLLIGGLMAPVFEEMAWRLNLHFTRINLALSSGFMSFYILGLLISEHGVTNLFAEFYTRIMLAWLVATVSYFTLSVNKVLDTVQGFFQKNFKWIYWLMIVSFAMIHLERYQNFGLVEHYIIIPLIILPQLVSASIFSYVRLKYGFIYATFLHILGNTYLQLIFS